VSRQDRAQFAEFVHARASALHRAAYLMVGDPQLAQDLVQEALTKTYVAWPRLRDPRNAEAYCRKAITTTAISWFRRRSWNNERPTEHLPDQTRGAGPEAGVVERDAVWRALQELPPRQRAALVLRFYEDLTEAQTADAMGCAVGTVKSQVSAALSKLRTRLGDEVELLSEKEWADQESQEAMSP
jgi:RNA polymerase sigma-70 factor (sigma-E family)